MRNWSPSPASVWGFLLCAHRSIPISQVRETEMASTKWREILPNHHTFTTQNDGTYWRSRCLRCLAIFPRRKRFSHTCHLQNCDKPKQNNHINGAYWNHYTNRKSTLDVFIIFRSYACGPFHIFWISFADEKIFGGFRIPSTGLWVMLRCWLLHRYWGMGAHPSLEDTTKR